MSRVSQPVLALLPAEASSVGPSAGLVEGPDGGVVFVFGLATFSYGAGDETGRRLAAVQLAATKIAPAVTRHHDTPKDLVKRRNREVSQPLCQEIWIRHTPSSQPANHKSTNHAAH